MWLKDPKTKEKSVTLTLLVIGFLVSTAKLAVSGITYNKFSMGDFAGAEYSLALGALAGLYAYRRKSEKKQKTENTND